MVRSWARRRCSRPGSASDGEQAQSVSPDATAALAHLTPPDATAVLSRGHITSNISVLGRRIEKYGLKRFIAHAETVRARTLLIQD